MSLAIYDRLEHLRRALFWEPDTMVMATSAVTVVKPYSMYIDDSGKKLTSLVFVGGWLARSDRWEEFQKKWIPKVTRSGKKEFKRSAYNQTKCGNEFLFELEDMIRDHTIYGFANGIYCEDWRKIANKYAMELYHLVPFSICARTCIGLVREWCADNNVSNKYMAYFMDKGSEGSGELTHLLNIDLSQEVQDVTVIPEDSKRFAAIQAADFLSWEIRNQYLINPDAQDWDELTPVLTQLIRGRFWALSTKGKIPKFGIYRAADIEKLCVGAKIPLKKDVPPAKWNQPKPIVIKRPALKP